MQHGKKNSTQWIQEHSSLPGEHNKGCLLAERSNKCLFQLLVLEDHRVSVAVSCSFFPSPGWWDLALELQRSVDAQQQGAPYKEPLCCCDGFWLPITPALCQSPHKHKSPAISRRSNPQPACVPLPSPASLTPVQPPLGPWVRATQESGPNQIWASSMAQQLEISMHNLSCKGSNTVSSKGARFQEHTPTLVFPGPVRKPFA